jgi:hypothetical protein
LIQKRQFFAKIFQKIITSVLGSSSHSLLAEKEELAREKSRLVTQKSDAEESSVKRQQGSILSNSHFGQKVFGKIYFLQ